MSTTDPITKAFNEGKAAGLDGQHIATCPYGPRLSDAWIDGWHVGAWKRSHPETEVSSPAEDPRTLRE